jgi:GT2 family glycosyltransferase
VSAVVVSYGHEDDLWHCLAALDGRYPVVVVDNSSTPGCRSVAGAAGATYVNPGRNLGFARGVNIGLELTRPFGDDILLLNPDAVADAATVSELQRRLRRHPDERLAAVAPRQRDALGREQRVEWPFPSPAGAWLQALALHGLSSQRCFLVGSVLLLRREAIDDVGRFDEQFFLYAEEADWQWRALLRGWRVALCRGSWAYHAGAGTSDAPTEREIIFHSSQELLLRKWYGNGGWSSARAACVLGSLGRSALLRGGRRRAALRRASLYLRGPRRTALSRGLL